jgi:hypothetical protein
MAIFFCQVGFSQIVTPQKVEICYGDEVSFSLSDFFESDEIAWMYSYSKQGLFEPLNESSFKLEINSGNFEKKDIYIKAVLNKKEESNIVEINFADDIEFELNLGTVCVNNLNSLQVVSSQTGLEYSWFLNEIQIGSGIEIDYYALHVGNYNVSVIAENAKGCTLKKEQEIIIEQEPIISMIAKEVVCSKGPTLFSLSGETQGIKIESFSCFKDGSQFSNYSEISQTSSSIEVKWGKVTEPVQLTCKIIFATNMGCTYSTETNVLLIEDEVPDPGEVFRKTASSNLLIYAGAEDVGLNYLWGKTTNGSDEIVDTRNSPYGLYNNIDATSEYWVDVSYISNSYCKTRNLYNGNSDSKYQIIAVSTIFPNPAIHTLNIRFDEKVNNVAVAIYDIQGMLLKNFEFAQPNEMVELDITDLRSGMYTVRLTKNNKTWYSETVLINK